MSVLLASGGATLRRKARSGPSRRRLWGDALLLSTLLGLGGCASTVPSSAANVGRPAREDSDERATPSGSVTSRHVAEPTLVTSTEAAGLAELVLRGEAALSRGELTLARREFQHALALQPTGELLARVLFGMGTSYDLENSYDDALVAYGAVGAQSSSLRTSARVRSVRILVHLERYAEAGRLSADLGGSALTTLDQLALDGALALAALEEPQPTDADLGRAQTLVSRARQRIDESGFGRVEVPPLEVAAVFFAAGEIERYRALQIGFEGPAVEFTERLERRCRHLLDAQAAYSEAMRSRNAHWSAMAGVRVGELYYDLHRDLMAMQPPQAAGTADQEALFWAAARLRYGILLRKAVKMLETTMAMLERTGEPTRFRALADEALARLREAEGQEQAALDALPYSREELRQALRQLDLKEGGRGAL